MTDYSLRKAECLRCGYSWNLRKPKKPDHCPKCKTHDFDKSHLTKEEAEKHRADGLRNYYLTHESKLKNRKMPISQREAISNATKGKKKPWLSEKFKREGNPNWKGENAAIGTGRDRALRWYKAPKGYDRHHKDGNPLNNSQENILIATRKEHMLTDGRANK